MDTGFYCIGSLNTFKVTITVHNTYADSSQLDRLVTSTRHNCPQILWTCSVFKFSIGDSLESRRIQFTSLTLPRRVLSLGRGLSIGHNATCICKIWQCGNFKQTFLSYNPAYVEYSAYAKWTIYIKVNNSNSWIVNKKKCSINLRSMYVYITASMTSISCRGWTRETRCFKRNSAWCCAQRWTLSVID